MANETSFLKKNIVTVIILIATVLLASIAIFTAIRLYQLRQQPVAPNQPASSPAAATQPIEVNPKSGNWSYPEKFTVKNTSSQALTVKYYLDCWDESICGDKEEGGSVSLAPGATLEKGLGNICSKWQLDLNWTGKPEGQWDWGGIAEKSTTCGTTEPGQCSLSFTIQASTPTGSPSSTPTATPSGSASPTATPTEPPRGGSSPTPTPTSSSTPSSSASPNASTTPKASATPTPAALPAAGIGFPTLLGIGAGFLLLIGAVMLAL